MNFAEVERLKLTQKSQGYGVICRFNPHKKLTGLKYTVIEKLYKDYENLLEEEFLRLMIMNENYTTDIDSNEFVRWNWIFSFFDKTIFEQEMRKYMFEQRLGLLEAFEKTCEEGIRLNYFEGILQIIRCDALYMEGLEFVIKTLSNAIYRYLLKKQFQSMKGDFIFQSDKFRREHFSYLPDNLKGFIFGEVGPIMHLISLSNERGFPVCIGEIPNTYSGKVLISGSKNEVILRPSPKKVQEYYNMKNEIENTYEIPYDTRYDKIKMHLKQGNIADIKKFVMSDWIQGMCFYKPHYLYSTTGSMPRSVHIAEDLSALEEIILKKEIFITLPELRPGRTIDFIGKYYLELDLYDDFPQVINEFIIGIRMLSIKYDRKVNLIIPQVRYKEDFNYWRLIVEMHFNTIEHYIPNIGISYDTEHSLAAYDEFEEMDFIIIDIDSLVEQYMGKSRYAEIDAEEFFLRLGPEIRWAHQHFRQYLTKKRHIIHGQCIVENPIIFRKLINKGFREFAFTANSILKVKGVLDKFINSRGVYVGVSQEKKRKILEKLKKNDNNDDDSSDKNNLC